MNRFQYLQRHFVPSVANWPRLLAYEPLFAMKLLYVRVFCFATRSMPFALDDPHGFTIDTPQVLNSYWGMFAERTLDEPSWIRSLKEDPAPVVLDVGANAGVFSHRVHLFRPDATIHAFEPLPAMAKRIRAWSARNPNLVLHECACSANQGMADFYTRTANDTTATLAPKDRDTRHAIAVSTTTIDAVVPDQRILLIKIDVENHELEVLRGATETLKRTDFVILEAHSIRRLEQLKKLLGNNWAASRLDHVNWLFFSRLRHGSDKDENIG